MTEGEDRFKSISEWVKLSGNTFIQCPKYNQLQGKKTKSFEQRKPRMITTGPKTTAAEKILQKLNHMLTEFVAEFELNLHTRSCFTALPCSAWIRELTLLHVCKGSAAAMQHRILFYI